MARASNAVNERVKELYALLATVAARKALHKADFDSPGAADDWVKHAERWLVRAGANHARHTYQRPKL